MATPRRLFHSLLLAAGLAGSLVAAPAFGQTYPNRPVKIIVPFATGGPADNYARSVAAAWGRAAVAGIFPEGA